MNFFDKSLYAFIMVLFISSSSKRENLNYPKNIHEISKVELIRPDKISKGKFLETRTLSLREIEELLNVLNNAVPIDFFQLIQNFYIVFTTKANETKRIKINGNLIKGYENDNSYRISNLVFLDNF